MNVSGPGASDAATTLGSVGTTSIDRDLDGAVAQIADKIVATTGASAAAATAVTLDTVATAAAATTEAAVVDSSETSAATAEAAAAAPAAAAASAPSGAADSTDASGSGDSTDASAFSDEQLADVSDVDQVEYSSGSSAPAVAAQQQQISAAQAQKMAEHVVRRAVDRTVASGVAGTTYESNYASELMDQQQILSQVSAPLEAMQSSRTLLTQISTNHLETQSDVNDAYRQLHDEAQQMPAYLNSTASPLDDGHLSFIDHEVQMFRVDDAAESLETPPLPPDRLG